MAFNNTDEIRNGLAPAITQFLMDKVNAGETVNESNAVQLVAAEFGLSERDAACALQFTRAGWMAQHDHEACAEADRLYQAERAPKRHPLDPPQKPDHAGPPENQGDVP